MNICYGQVNFREPLTPQSFDRLNKAFVGGELIHRHNRWAMCAANNSPSWVGMARQGDVYLLFLGTFTRNQPGWSGSTSMDAPDEFAAYLLNRYCEKAMDFLEEVHGTFSMAICDGSRDRFLLVTDHSGIHKWFIKQDDQGVAFSSKLTLLAEIAEGLALDRTYEEFLLGYEVIPFGHTFYQNIEILPAGTVLMLERGKASRKTLPKPGRFASPWSRQEMEAKSEAELTDKLYEILLAALEDQVTQKDEVAVLLGGFDSSLIAAMLARLGKKVSTFSFYFSSETFNQPFTEKLAEVVGNAHHWIEITPDVIQEGLSQFANHFNQVASQPHYLIQTRYLCERARDYGFSQALTGDGCDGAFLGYPTVHRRYRLIRALQAIPRPILRMLQRLSGSRFLEDRLGHPYRLAGNVLTILQRSMPARGHIASRILGPESLAHLRKGPAPPNQPDPEALLRELAQGLEDMPPVRLAYHGKGMVGLNKAKLDGSSSVTGLTLQSPFMHPSLNAFASALPESLLRPGEKSKHSNFGKYILMKMAQVKNLLPEEIIYQKKRSPVCAPVDTWYLNQLRPFLMQEFSNLPFETNPAYLDRLVSDKFTERLFRKYIAIDHLALHAAAILVTYAQFSKKVR